MTRWLSRRHFLGGLAASVSLAACQGRSPDGAPPAPATPISLYGAGATFPSFLYLRWLKDYNTQKPEVQISYQPIGSAAGIQQFTVGTLDFGASDIPLTPTEISQVPQGVVMVPTTGGSVAVVYNLPGVPSGLKLSRQVLPAIFAGQITRWNDPQLVALNPDRTLPDLPIQMVHRSDGSGTTAVFTAHLSAISPAWQTNIGSGLSVQWPAGTGIKDNAGISAQIQQGEGTIGYVEYAFAKQLNLATAALENQAGQYVQPSTETAEAALATVTLSDELQGTVPDPAGNNAYPIVTYSWLLLYETYADAAKAQALKDFVRWGLTDGQAFATDLGYVPLPAEIAERGLKLLEQVNG